MPDIGGEGGGQGGSSLAQHRGTPTGAQRTEFARILDVKRDQLVGGRRRWKGKDEALVFLVDPVRDKARVGLGQAPSEAQGRTSTYR